MSSWSVNSPAAYLQRLIKTTGHQGAVFVASEVQFHLNSSMLPLVLLQQYHFSVNGSK